MVKIILILCYLNCAFGNFIGPFVLWGRPELEKFDVPALEIVDDKVFRNLYSESTAVVMFLRNSSNSLNVQNFPKFKDIIDQSHWTYLSQHWLSLDPLDYNSNTEVYNLVGESTEQDAEIDEIYKNATKKHGDGNVLGILATKLDNHDLSKRELDDASTTVPSPTDEPMNDNFVYIALGKAMIYTTNAPKLTENGVTTELFTHGLVTTDERGDLYRIIVSFKVNRTDEVSKLYLRFRFPIFKGYWTLTSIEVEDSTTEEYFIVGKPPTAPLRFSYKCSQSVVFKNKHSSTLTFQNIQIQPLMNGDFKFGDAYDCVGFTTAPIWSGIIVATFIGSIILLGLFCILEIRTPNKFENVRGKQLTFTTQE